MIKILQKIKNLIIENLPDEQKENETLVDLYKYCVGVYFILNKYILDNVKDGKTSIIKESIRDVIIKRKYYKYKNKYLKLKELIGGGKGPNFLSLDGITNNNYTFTVFCGGVAFSTVRGKSKRGNPIIYLQQHAENISGFEVESGRLNGIEYYTFGIEIDGKKYYLCGDNSEGNLILQENPQSLSKFKIVNYKNGTYSLFIMTDDIKFYRVINKCEGPVDNRKLKYNKGEGEKLDIEKVKQIPAVGPDVFNIQFNKIPKGQQPPLPPNPVVPVPPVQQYTSTTSTTT